MQNGGEVKPQKEVVSIEKKEHFMIHTKDGDMVETKFIVNAAGVYADEVHNMVCKKTFEIHPRAGEYFVMDKKEGARFHHTIFQCPSEMRKGILVTPTMHGNLLVGPDAIDIER